MAVAKCSFLMNAIWIIDEHKLRREGTAGFLATWAKAAAYELRQVERAEHIIPAELLSSDSKTKELCILGVGGGSLTDEAVRCRILELLDVLAFRPLVVISDAVDDLEVKVAAKLGVRGLIPTILDSEVAIRAISFVLAGGTYLPSKTIARSIDTPKPIEALGASAETELVPNGKSPVLSERQHDVLQALQKGHSNKVIARELNLSEATVKIHVRSLLKKYGASNRTQVAIMAADPSLTPSEGGGKWPHA